MGEDIVHRETPLTGETLTEDFEMTGEEEDVMISAVMTEIFAEMAGISVGMTGTSVDAVVVAEIGTGDIR